MKVDLAIIGGGGAAFAAAAKADELGISAVLINKGLPLGGTCVNVGCVPSKFLLETGFDRFRAAHPRFGSVSAVSPSFDFSQAIQEKERIVKRNRETKYKDVLSGFKTVKLLEERAHFEGPGRIRAGSELVEAKHVLIATGSSNKRLDIPGLNTLAPSDILDNVQAFSLSSLPKSMIVLGAGPTGLEVAQMFSHFGTHVTVVEAKPRAFAITEPEISEGVKKLFDEDGISILTNAKVRSVRKDGSEIALFVEMGAKEREFRAEKLFSAIGIRGNTNDLNLSAVGLQADRNGFLDVDDLMRTRVAGIWAAGDVAGPPWLETLAAREGAVAVENAFNAGKLAINYDAVPYAVFTHPQIAGVGLTEEEFVRRFGRCECRTVPLRLVPKADITGETTGLAKMAIHPESKKIVGFHLISPVAAESIHEAALAIAHGLTVDDLVNMIHVFPTYTEIVKIVAQAFRRDVEHMSCCVE